MRKFWNIRAAADTPDAGEILIYGPIGSDSGLGWLFDEITPKQFKADLDALGDVSEIRVFINSEGGDVFAAQSILTMLKRHAATVTVHIDGLAASAASIIAMAGDKVIMPRNAMMMVHNPWTFSAGDSEEFRKVADMLDQVRESIVAAYEDKTGMSRDELIALLNAETWMTAEEAVEFGFADEIEKAQAVAASLIGQGVLMINGRAVDLKRFDNPPKLAFLGGAKPSRSDDTYANQGASVMEALSEFEQRTSARASLRAKAGRSLSDADIQRWEQIQDMASRVLGEIAAGADQPEAAAKQEAERVFVEFQALTARLHGADV